VHLHKKNEEEEEEEAWIIYSLTVINIVY